MSADLREGHIFFPRNVLRAENPTCDNREDTLGRVNKKQRKPATKGNRSATTKNETGLKKSASNNEARPQPWKASLWFEPSVFMVLTLGIFFLTPPLSWPGNYAEAYAAVGAYLTPVLNQSLAILGIVSTVIVSIAVMTRFGFDSELLHPKLHQVLTSVLLATFFLLLLVAACGVRVATVDSGRWPEVIIVLGLTWMLSLAARLAIGRAAAQAQADDGTRRWLRQKWRAEKYGLHRKNPVPARTRRGTALVFVVPQFLWALTWATVAIRTMSDHDAWRGFALPMYAIFPPLTILAVSLTWWVSRDLSLTLGGAVYALMPPICLALASSGLLVVVIIVTPYERGPWVGVGIGAIALISAQIAFMAATPARRSVRWIRDTEDAATITSLRAVRKKAKELQRKAAAALAKEDEKSAPARA